MMRNLDHDDWSEGPDNGRSWIFSAIAGAIVWTLAFAAGLIPFKRR